MRCTSRFILGIATLAVLTLTTQTMLAHGAERGAAKATVKGAHLTIDYGRPMLKGRDPLSLIKPGQVWRIGADSSTTLESDHDLDIGGTRVPKGEHILLVRFDGDGKWTLIVSSKPWNQYSPDAKLAETPMKYTEGTDSVEMVTIKLTDGGGSATMDVAWGKLRLAAEIKPAA